MSQVAMDEISKIKEVHNHQRFSTLVWYYNTWDFFKTLDPRGLLKTNDMRISGRHLRIKFF